MIHGRIDPVTPIEAQGFAGFASVHYNLFECDLLEAALLAGEGRLGQGGTLLVETGRFTGRSPKDKHVVRCPGTEDQVWWEANAAMEPAAFERLRADMLRHAQGLSLHVQDLWAGADESLRLNIRLVAERAWHALFLRHLLRRPPAARWRASPLTGTILNLPSFQADSSRHGCRSETVVAIDWETRWVLIAAPTTAARTRRPCSPSSTGSCRERRAYHALLGQPRPDDPDDAAVFFGLSGTGKTTLSSDPSRVLLGDDEHRLVRPRPLQHRGGCYAKTSTSARG
jgi:phosphoenolpyruvate carboxykinase (ATP)